MTVELNKFPFTESSTMILDDRGYRFPLGVMVDAMFYPKCQNNPPYNVSAISKTSTDVELTVSDNTGSSVFVITVPLNSDYSCDYVAGVGRQGDYYCGGCIFSSELKDWITALTNVPLISTNSLIFTSSAVCPQGGVVDTLGSIKYNGSPVSGIDWGVNIAHSSSSASMESLDGSETPGDISSIIINDVELTGDAVYITPKKNSMIRVSCRGDITIGRVDYL